MNTTPARPNRSEPEQNPSLFRLSHRWFRARANPLYLLLYIAVIAGIAVYGDPNPDQIHDDIANTLFALLFFIGPVSDAYMYKDRRRNGYLAFWSPFTIGFSGLVAQYLTSERRKPHEASHISLAPFKMRNRIDNAYRAFHGYPKSLDLLKKKKQQEKEQKQLSKTQRLQDKRTHKVKRAQAKLDKKNDIQNKRIEASHQHMDAIHLLNRWLRGRRNPIYGILSIALIYFLIQQRGWELAGWIMIYICVIMPLQVTSDGHMSDLRNLKRDSVQGGSMITIGLAGVIAQYATRDGSVPHQKSLSNPMTLFTSLVSKDRRIQVKTQRVERRLKKKQDKKTLEAIVGYIDKTRQRPTWITYADLNQLCNTNLFVIHASPDVTKLIRGEQGLKYDRNEVFFFLEVLRNDFTAVKNLGSALSISDSLRHNNFERLRSAYPRLEVVAKRLNDQHEARVKSDIQRQERVRVEESRKAQLARQAKAKHDQLMREAILRDELPELRIKQLSLHLPRAPQDPADFEHICRDWLEAWGDTNVFVTQISGDGGIDVISDNCVAQVKYFTTGPVGRPDLQQLAGAAIPSGKKPIFFAYNGYTKEAMSWAQQLPMYLFTFHAHSLKFQPANTHAAILVRELAQLHLA